MSQPSSEPALRVERLSYRYPGGGLTVDNVSFSAEPGERIAIVGPSGAGKSTLLRHVNGLLPDRGELPSASSSGHVAVRVDGLPVARDNLREIRRRVGFLFQDPDDQLFCPTVREDVAFGPLNLGLAQAEVLDRVRESLAAVGLEGFADRSTLKLSLGERKRVCLAGVLACQPTLLALDEPFGNLDPRARRQLLSILTSFVGSQLIATHDLDLVVDLCSRVIVLDGGRIQADGRTREVLGDARLMQRHGLEVPLTLRLAT